MSDLGAATRCPWRAGRAWWRVARRPQVFVGTIGPGRCDEMPLEGRAGMVACGRGVQVFVGTIGPGGCCEMPLEGVAGMVARPTRCLWRATWDAQEGRALQPS
jgi:hypothetical protein